MDLLPADQVQLLNTLLNAARSSASSNVLITGNISHLETAITSAETELAGVALIQSLLRFPTPILKSQRSTLFDAIKVLNLENPHSDFLSWLLEPSGPLHETWLLKLLFEKFVRNRTWPGPPISVEREVECGTGRVDILVKWNDFRLAIENKVWSPEGDRQVLRYLDGFHISSENIGCVIYLNPYGRWPSNVPMGDARVVAASYDDLANLLKSGLASKMEPNSRGRVFANEFLECIYQLLGKVGDSMSKPAISDATKLWLANSEHLAAIREQAVRESLSLVRWVRAEAERRLRQILGQEMTAVGSDWELCLSLPGWICGQVQFTIAYGYGSNYKDGLAGEGEKSYVGILLRMADGSQGKAAIFRAISDELNDRLGQSWPIANDIDSPEHNCPLWRYMPVPLNGDVDHWIEEVLHLMEEIAQTLGPVLTKAAAEL